MEFCENSTFPPFWAICHTYSTSLLKFLRKSNTKNKFLEKIAAKIAQKSNTTKKEFLEENAAKIVLFEEKKTFFNFLLDFRKKKKQ
jgi:hypothetical protein